MSKPVKQLIMQEYLEKLEGANDALLVSLRGISSNNTNTIRADLAKKDIRVTIIRNSLARKAFEGSGLSGLSPVLTGSSAIAYGAESVVEVARELIAMVKDFPGIELKGAVLDGELFAGAEGVERLSKFPTRDEAIAQTVTLILSPARKLMGSVKGPGGRLMGVVKAIEEKLEKGEAIAKVS